jgi:hypothetical protein
MDGDGHVMYEDTVPAFYWRQRKIIKTSATSLTEI